MFSWVKRNLLYQKRMPYVNMALSRAAAVAPLRKIDLTDPRTWEFSGFSQNGEDGLIDVLTRQLTNPNHYFIEIGSAYGLENNTSWLAIARKYSGLMIDGDRRAAEHAGSLMADLNAGVKCLNLMATRENIGSLRQEALYLNPDVFSLDIDGIDYYVAKEILDAGLRPKIFVVEYNAVFGPDQALTVTYNADFDYGRQHPSKLYFGASVQAWKKLFSQYNYQFVTVDMNGCNAIFVLEKEFPADFCRNIKGLPFQDNSYQLARFREPWEKRFEIIKHLPYKVV
jgi:hypothetical protein